MVLPGCKLPAASGKGNALAIQFDPDWSQDELGTGRRVDYLALSDPYDNAGPDGFGRADPRGIRHRS